MSTPFADTKTIRAALFDLLDSQPWCFSEQIMPSWTEDDANRERMRFVEQVVARIDDLQSAPFDGVNLKTLCARHIMIHVDPDPKVACAECSAEQKAKGHTV